MAQVSARRVAIYESLNSILSPDSNIRTYGEESLKALEVTEEYGAVLAQITVDSSENTYLRQLASVMLRQYVEHHWSSDAEKFSVPEVTKEMKVTIRSLIPQGLTESESRVRSSVAYAIASIAHWDWPEEWPELFNILMQALTSADGNAVHGSMRVLTEFTSEISETQMAHVAPVILPEMYRIFVSTGVYSNRTRARAVNIFSTCTSLIVEFAQSEKKFVKQLLAPVLPQFLAAFIQALQSEDDTVTDPGMKAEVMKALTILVKNVPSLIAPHFGPVVTCVYGQLITCSETFVNTIVNELDDADDPVDSDGEILSTESLIYSTFEFIHALVDTSRYHSVIKKNIQQLLYYVLFYMEVTADQERVWSENPGQFVEDEDDDSFAFSVRISAQDLYLALMFEFEEAGLQALIRCIQSHLAEAEQSKLTGNQHWWKAHECILLALGHVRMILTDAIKEGKVQFSVIEFLHKIVLQDLEQASAFPFLSGRCLWMASCFVHAMDASTIQRFLSMTVTGLGEQQPSCVRISAVRAVFNFCDMLSMTKQTQLMEPHLQALFDHVMLIAQGYGTEVLALCLDSLESLLKVNNAFTCSVTEKAMPFFMAVFLKYSHDQHLIELCKDAVKQLAAVSNSTVQQKMLPTLVSVINQGDPDRLPNSLQPSALEMLETLVRGSPEPLSDELMLIFPLVANMTIHTDDRSIMQNGGEVLRAYISKSAQQIVEWQDDKGQTGLFYIGSVVSKLLDPKSPEFSAAYVGKLVSMLISKLGDQMGSDMQLILRAVLSKLQQTETLTIVQELIIVFARLILANVEPLLDFLTLTPGPDGEPALKFVLTQWCTRQHLFFGAYETKVGAMALSKLLLHAINTNDSRLQEIYLKEEVISQSSVIRTRSKAKESGQVFQDTPVLIKIYKLLINELAHQMEECTFNAKFAQSSNGKQCSDEEDEYQDIDSEDSEEDLLSNLITNDYFEEDEEDDPDVLNDPIYQINLKEYLTEFLQSLARTPFFDTFKAHHNAQEQKVLAHIGIPVH